MIMSTKYTNQEVVDFFADILNPKGDALIESNARLLMGQYLIQIERTLEEKSITQKELAHSIGISASYLSQCFNLNKLINFKTLAKIELALNISFQLKSQGEEFAYSTENTEKFINYIVSDDGQDLAA